MNLSDLSVYLSKENLTTRFVDYSNVYLLPLVCLVGIITSLLSVIVSFKRDESNAKTLDYIFLNSSIDLIFLIIQSFLFIFRCGALCHYGYAYFSKFYEIYIYLFVGYVLVSSQVFLNIYVSVERLRMFSSKISIRKQVSIFKVYAVCVCVSVPPNILLYAAYFQVLPLGLYMPLANSSYSEMLYMRASRPEFETSAMKILLTAVSVIKDTTMISLLCLLTIIVCIKFRRHLNAKKRLIPNSSSINADTPTVTGNTGSTQLSKRSAAASAERKEANFTLLTVLFCMNFFIGNFIDAYSIVPLIFSIDIYVMYGFINIIGNFLFFFSHGFPFCLYFFFNRVFRDKFKQYFRLA